MRKNAVLLALLVALACVTGPARCQEDGTAAAASDDSQEDLMEVKVFLSPPPPNATEPVQPQPVASSEPAVPSNPVPVMLTADATGPTAAVIVATTMALEGDAAQFAKYAFAATPLSGGATVTAVSASPEARLRGLQPGTEYSVVVVGALPNGQATPTSAALLFATPAAGAAVLARALPTGPTTAALVLNAPLSQPAAGEGAPDSYLVQMCPAGQLATGAACPAASCPGGAAACNVVGLQPGTVYDVVAVAVTGGQQSPPSAAAVLVTPAAGLPALIDAQPASATAAVAVAKSPDNATFVSYTFVAEPLNGGAAVNATSPEPRATLPGLAPATVYEIRVWARLPDGSATATSNTATLATPPAGGPVIEAAPTASQNATVRLLAAAAAPPTGSAWARYDLTVCPLGGSTCATTACDTTTASCAVQGLRPATSYLATVVAVRADGATSPPSNEALFTTPAWSAAPAPQPTGPAPNATAPQPTTPGPNTTAAPTPVVPVPVGTPQLPVTPIPVSTPGTLTAGRLLPADRAQDWSLAGYREGSWAIPSPPISYNVRAFGARGDGATDDTEPIQRAIEAANRAPGVVFFPPGVYILRRPITVVRSRVILRGAGPDKTVIHIPLALGDVYPGTWSEGSSEWNSGGGFINFLGARQRSDNGGTLLALVDGPVAAGSPVIPVRNTARLRPGQRIRVFVNDRSTYNLRRRKLMGGEPGEGGAADATTLPASALGPRSASDSSSSSSSSISGQGVPQWVRNDPVWQVAKEASAASFGSEAHGHSSGASSGSGGVSTKELHAGDDGDEGAGAALEGELAEAWANFTAGGEAAAAALELPGGAGEGLPPAPKLPAYDGSEDADAQEDREAVSAAAQAGNQGLWERERSSGSRKGSNGDGGASRRRRRSLLYDGPKPGTILNWLYGEGLVDTGTDEGGVVDKDEVVMSAKVAAVRPGYVIMDRPLVFPVKTEQGWVGAIHLDWPSIEDSGVEGLTVRFKHELTEEHHNSRGFNGIQVAYASNVWVRNVRVLNADNALFYSWVHRSSILDLTVGVTASRVNGDHRKDLNGHRGIGVMESQNILVQRLQVAAPFIHDITISDSASMNVFADSAGWNLNLDHHRTAPWANLFTNMNMGYGTRPFASGGRGDRGAHSGRGNVYWGLRSNSGRPLPMPPCGFGPYLSFVGYYAGWSCPNLGWVQQPLAGKPNNLYEAQRRRFGRG